MGAGSSSVKYEIKKQLESASTADLAAAVAELDTQDKEKFLAAVQEAQAAEKPAEKPAEAKPAAEKPAEAKWWLPPPGILYTSVTNNNTPLRTPTGAAQKQDFQVIQEANATLQSEAGNLEALAAAA